jgi:hypothetical protein
MAIDTVVEEVADNLEEIAEATRRVDTKAIGFFLGGAAVGIAIGFYFGHRWNKEKLKAEAFEESKAEVDMIREVYQQKIKAAEPKPTIDEVVEEKGYGERPLPAPVPVYEPPMVVTIEPPEDVWEWEKELDSRTQDAPYVIHQEEFMKQEKGYLQVAYTYYAIDDVLADEDDHPVPHGDLIVGLDNLKFGHGTDDDDVVFVRNDEQERDMEICRVQKSFEQEVLGLNRDEAD